jgi:hypothetical protein
MNQIKIENFKKFCVYSSYNFKIETATFAAFISSGSSAKSLQHLLP